VIPTLDSLGPLHNPDHVMPTPVHVIPTLNSLGPLHNPDVTHRLWPVEGGSKVPDRTVSSLDVFLLLLDLDVTLLHAWAAVSNYGHATTYSRHLVTLTLTSEGVSVPSANNELLIRTFR
jgi:hypothetical protein